MAGLTGNIVWHPWFYRGADPEVPTIRGELRNSLRGGDKIKGGGGKFRRSAREGIGR